MNKHIACQKVVFAYVTLGLGKLRYDNNVKLVDIIHLYILETNGFSFIVHCV